MGKAHKNNKYVTLIIWTTVYVAISAYIQMLGVYHLFYIEQWQTFFYDKLFITDILSKPCGIAYLISYFLIQFFYYPYCGALILGLILTLIAWLIYKAIRKVNPRTRLHFIGLIPSISLLFIQLSNIKYHLGGTIGYLIVIIGIYSFLCFKKKTNRLIFSVFATPLIYIVAGPSATLFAFSILLIGLFLYPRQAYLFLLPLLCLFLASSLTIILGLSGTFSQLLLMDGYFSCSITYTFFAYLPWSTLLIILFIALVSRKNGDMECHRQQAIITISEIVISFAFCLIMMNNYYDRHDEIFCRIAYFTRYHKWDKVIDICKHVNMSSYLNQKCCNIALAEKGLLAEKLFDYPQAGIQSIYLSENVTSPYAAITESDICFSMGCISMSQHWAFEANESMGNSSAYAYQRLIQTSLIFGEYRVAEKYISLLEHTLIYHKWAESQRKFLYNDRAIEHDSILGPKKRCLFPENSLDGLTSIESDLIHIIDHNPLHRTTIQYLSAIYMLSDNNGKFNEMIKRYYGTEALRYMPKYFQKQ